MPLKKKINKVFIATSLDGYIADKDGGLAWLDTIPEINTIDTGYKNLTESIDALVMGRNTYETICSFDIDWPYTKPVYVVSQTLDSLEGKFKANVQLLKGGLDTILSLIHAEGHMSLYIDGGRLIQSFLKEDLIDEMIITIIPVLLGSGIPLFSEQELPLRFNCVKTNLFLESVVQNHFIRFRENV